MIAAIKWAPVKYQTQVAAIKKWPIVYIKVRKIDPEFSFNVLKIRFFKTSPLIILEISIRFDFPNINLKNKLKPREVLLPASEEGIPIRDNYRR